MIRDMMDQRGPGSRQEAAMAWVRELFSLLLAVSVLHLSLSSRDRARQDPEYVAERSRTGIDPQHSP